MTSKNVAKLVQDDPWESGELGRDEEHVAVATDSIEEQINDSLGLQPVSIRLQKTLIDEFKMIAKYHGIGYQPLMRQVLTRFAECEKKQILNQLLSEREKEAEA
ncbi:MAG: hypothetical protein U5S82_03485 [Gammaproteobacteria bacterium]|nr:hypothetical protein [Gammaproteobacteria bacterium]